MIDPSYYTVRMAMGKRKRDRQPIMWVPSLDRRLSGREDFLEDSTRGASSHVRMKRGPGPSHDCGSSGLGLARGGLQ